MSLEKEQSLWRRIADERDSWRAGADIIDVFSGIRLLSGRFDSHERSMICLLSHDSRVVFV